MSKQPTARRTIGADPFAVQPLPDEQEGDRPARAVAAPPPPAKPEPPRQPAKPKAPKRQKATVNVRLDLMERVKNASYWVPGLTVTAIVEIGLMHALEQIEKKHGGPYPARESELVGGRPLGT
jgi:hypothetical protein